MAIPSGVILIWTGTNASIPTGWERVTDLDDKYPKAWGAENPNVTGGSNTHTHSDGGHSHTLTAHTHSCSLESNNSGGSCDGTAGSSAAQPHTHGSASIDGTSGGSLQSKTITWESINQEPPYYKVIFIKPSNTVGIIQSGICAYYNETSVPIGWYYCDGNNSTPDLRNKYLKGASTGADAGTTGGALTHGHTITHNHTANSHTHSGTSATSNPNNKANGSDTTKAKAHTHTITLAAATDTISNYTDTTAGNTDTVEPAYKKIGVIKNSGGSLKKNIVGLWLGSVSSLPVNWQVCDGTNGTLDLRDKFIKIGTDLSENNNTGGSNTHTHTAVSHTHTPTGTHTHTGSTGNPSAVNAGGGSGTTNAWYQHTHNVSVTATTASYSSDNSTPNTVSNQPDYRTAAYIQLNKLDLGGASLYNML